MTVMCSICNGTGGTYRFHAYGYELIPCSEKTCQERNQREWEASRQRVAAKLAEAEQRFIREGVAI